MIWNDSSGDSVAAANLTTSIFTIHDIQEEDILQEEWEKSFVENYFYFKTVWLLLREDIPAFPR